MSHSYQIHNHRDRVHNVVDFTFAGPGHELVGHRHEIYISQIAMNLFPLMKILSFHYHRHKTLSGLDSKQNHWYNTRNRNCLPFMNILCHPPPLHPAYLVFNFLVFCVVIFVLCLVINVSCVSGLSILDYPFTFLQRLFT